MPSSSDPQLQKSFFDCAACLMTSNLQSLCLNSLTDFMAIFKKALKSIRKYEHPGEFKEFSIILKN